MVRVRRLVPAFILIIGLIASIAAAMVLSKSEVDRREARFQGLVNSSVGSVQSRMLVQLTLLRGMAGFFNASDEVDRDEFTAYVARLNLEDNYPGVLGMGYSAYAPDRLSIQSRVAAASGDHAGLRHWPDGNRPGFSSILYIEPMNRLNLQALGFDMMSERTRRTAMEAAAESGLAWMSGRVQLVQEIDPVKQPGFLIYLPLYRDGIETPDRLHGWVYSPLRAHDLFGAMFRDQDLPEHSVEVFDEEVDEDRLLFRSGAVQSDPGRSTVRKVEIAGRTWAVRITSSPSFDADSTLAPARTVAVAGLFITLLIAALSWQQLRSADRTEAIVERRTTELRDSNERLLAEASAREEAEAQVRQMQKMEAIGQLTGGIAHDFNNMLAVIIGNLDLAQRRSDDRSRVDRSIGQAREAAVRAADLTQRLLAFGRRQALAPRPIDPNALLRGMEELLRRAIGESIRTNLVLSEALWKISADPIQLENAILNLAINARDAMPDGGTLTIATANHVRSAEAPGVGKGGDYVQIAIIDEGRGMTPEVAAKAIEPFFTTKPLGRGTGLGLSQVYGFVRQSGGDFNIRTSEETGTTVEILLPRYGGEELPGELPATAEEATPTGRPEEVVLVVEDEAQVRDISVETLRELGYTVLSARGGKEALAILESRKDVRLLFTDLVMPEMNGRRLAARARAQQDDLKLLFTTGYDAAVIDRDGALEQDAALILKPFTAAELARKVREALDR